MLVARSPFAYSAPCAGPLAITSSRFSPQSTGFLKQTRQNKGFAGSTRDSWAPCPIACLIGPLRTRSAMQGRTRAASASPTHIHMINTSWDCGPGRAAGTGEFLARRPRRRGQGPRRDMTLGHGVGTWRREMALRHGIGTSGPRGHGSPRRMRLTSPGVPVSSRYTGPFKGRPAARTASRRPRRRWTRAPHQGSGIA